MKITSKDGAITQELINGIVFIESEDGHMGIDEARESFAMTMSLSNNENTIVYLDLSKVKYQTKEFRVFFSSKEVSEKIKACAIFSDSIFGKMVANFYMGLNKPICPTRLFTSKEEAIKWLNQFK